METLLLMDLNNIIHRSYHSHINLSFNGNHTGAFYGSLKRLQDVINIHNPSLIVFCDDITPYFRKEVFPSYKEGRVLSGNIDDIKTNKKNFIDFLKFIDIPIIGIKGYEADDLIYILIQRSKAYTRVIVDSNDSDLNQAFQVRDKLFLLRKTELYDEEKFVMNFNIFPQDWIKVEALKGSHNNIPGIPKIGIKTALKIINDQALWEDIYSKHKNDLDLWMSLIKLPYKDVNEDITVRQKSQGFNNLAFISFLSKFGVQVDSNMIQAFSDLQKKETTFHVR